MLIHYCQQRNQSQWAQALPFVTFAYNSSQSQSTKNSPFYLLYGRNPNFPIDLSLSPEINKIKMADYLKFITKEWPFIRDQAQLNSEEAKGKQIDHHKQNHKLRTYEIGDLVLKEVKPRLNKLDPKFEGPFSVEEKIGETTYIISDQEDTDIKIQVHGSQLKPYQSKTKTSIPKLINLLLLLFLIPCFSCLEYGSPLIWRETHHKIVKGRVLVNYTTAFVNPCNQSDIVYPQHVATLNNCDISFHPPSAETWLGCVQHRTAASCSLTECPKMAKEIDYQWIFWEHCLTNNY